MTERPLLFFPTKESATRSRLHGGPSRYKTPTTLQQGARLAPKLQELSDTLEAQRISLQLNPTNTEPEYVLVFETIGSVENFISAVSCIEGFEWLIEKDEVFESTDEFHELDNSGERKSTHSANGKLYMIFTNQRAMTELLSLWNLWLQNPNFNCRSGEHRGKGKFKDVFKHLVNIRKWGIEDRLEETGAIDAWRERLEWDSEQPIIFEIELWYRGNPEGRLSSRQTVCELLVELGGRMITYCDIADIAYHAILAELPANAIHSIIENTNVNLMRCDAIMFFCPTGQIVMENGNQHADVYPYTNSNEYRVQGVPVVAILDGYPLANHSSLVDRIIIDDPDNFGADYQVDEMQHGTAMCSLIIKGDLSSNNHSISSPLYVRPIMKPNPFNRIEHVPEDTLIVDTIHRAVKRMFEGEAGELAVAPNIKIINLSIGIPNQRFCYTISPLARIIDWLSLKYNVLFIVSAGNSYNEFNIANVNFNNFSPIDKEKYFVESILCNRRNNRIMSPAESINCITIGATHSDNTTISRNDIRFNPYSSIMPSTYTSFGSGHKNAIKPDIVYDGGRQMYETGMMQRLLLEPTKYKRIPGICVARPDSTLNNVIYNIGTSNSCALMTRNGSICHDVIKDLIQDHQIADTYTSILIKAMLTHGCSWDNIGNNIRSKLNNNLDTYSVKRVITNWIGYGYPDIEKVLECTPQRATVIGVGELNDEGAHVYSFPLPPSLSPHRVKRRLTITLAWMTPISSISYKYRRAKLWFEPSNNEIARNRIYYNDKAVKRGTLQHEIFEGDDARAFVDGDNIKIKVNCTKEASSFEDAIKYALIVSLEVAEGLNYPIYQEVKDRIRIPIPIEEFSI